MSRIGRQPIAIPEGVTVSQAEGKIVVKGPKGELSRDIDSRILIKLEDGKVSVGINKENADKEIAAKVAIVVTNPKERTDFMAMMRSERDKAEETIDRIFFETSEPLGPIIAPFLAIARKMTGTGDEKGKGRKKRGGN